MPDYVALHWNVDCEVSHRIGWVQRAISQDETWRLAIDEPGRLVAVSAPAALNVRRMSDGAVVIGDVFARDGGDPSWPPGGAAGFPAVCRTLVEEAWGRYVALGPPEAGRAAVLRDPMGGLECITFDAAGAQVVASTLPDWLIVGLSPKLSIDWSVLHRQFGRSGIAGGAALWGAQALAPGEYLDTVGKGKMLWLPADIARRGPTADETLVGLVDMCIKALTSGRRVLTEVSGGFDSAVVASALGAIPSSREGPDLINYHTEEIEGDERAYARLVADRTGLNLIERRKPEFAFDEASLREFSGAVGPAIWGVDARYDRDVADQCRALGADAILSGKGGDSVFFQMPTPMVFADRLRSRGLASLTEPILPSVARWTRRSVWSVLGSALFCDVTGRRVSDHPWLSEISDLPPGKRLHLRSLTQCLSFAGPSRRASAAHFIHPLLAQPVVEHCLSRPSFELTQGRRDRAYARTCFEARLPPEIAWRHGKGDATAHFGRAVAAHLQFLRGYLLEGLLATQGVLDRRRLERSLSLDRLIWSGGAGDVLQAAAMEGWARGWERRLRTSA